MFPTPIALALHAGTAICIAWLIWMFWRHPEPLRLATKALLRRRGFTAILFSTIFTCTLSLLAMGGYFQHSFWGLSESTIRSETGHFQIMRRGYMAHSRTDPWRWKLDRPDRIRQMIASDTFLNNRIETIAPELSFTGILSNGQVSRTFLGRAVDPAADRKLSAFGEQLFQGARFLEHDRSVALVGKGLAQSLSAKPTSGLTLLTTTAQGSMASCDLEVKGVTETFSRDYDDVALKIPLATAWDMFGDTLCDKVLILLRDSRDLDTVLSHTQALARKTGFDLETRRWEELATYYQSVRTLYTGIFQFFAAILLVFSFVFVSCILQLSLFQRQQEIALMRSFGASPRSLLQRFMTESVLLGIAGTVISCILSLGVVMFFNLHGLEASPPPGSSHGYLIQLRVFEEPGFILQVAEFVCCSVAISSIIPCVIGCRRPLIESLRHG